MDAERLGDGSGDEARLADGCEVDEDGAIFEFVDQAGGHFDREIGKFTAMT